MTKEKCEELLHIIDKIWLGGGLADQQRGLVEKLQDAIEEEERKSDVHKVPDGDYPNGTYKNWRSDLYKEEDSYAEPKIRRMTNRELAKWCAQGNGEYKYVNYVNALTEYLYNSDEGTDCPVDDDILIRAWDEEEWHEPLVEVEE